MPLSLAFYLNRIFTLPPHITLKKAVRKLKNRVRMKAQRRLMYENASFSSLEPYADLLSYLAPLPVELLLSHQENIKIETENILNHRFDLLGSGLTHVKHGIQCKGRSGLAQPPGKKISRDIEGNWLNDFINSGNLAAAKPIWRKINPNYNPIDWQLDFISGYRWNQNKWFEEISYQYPDGADIKVPWELSRMQHLVYLAWGFRLAQETQSEFQSPDVYLREYQNQILDFIATNPPSFGPNWKIAMDVAIRAVNWLISYDLLRAHGAKCENEFNRIFVNSIYDHGKYIFSHLEWDARIRGNHYLSNLVGLIFIGGYLPSTPETETWLAFGIRELIKEFKSQFHEDGSNFEASTSYHRLSSEFIIFATALVLGLSNSKKNALIKFNYRLLKQYTPFDDTPLTFSKLKDSQDKSPFPTWYFQKLERLAEFTLALTKPNLKIPQIGDNDNGRLLKPTKVYNNTSAKLGNHDPTQKEVMEWQSEEDLLDHRALIATANGLYDDGDRRAAEDPFAIDTHLIKGLSNQASLSRYQEIHVSKGVATTDEPDVSLTTFQDFGISIYRSPYYYFSIRCGSVGQNGNGGHAHNDQLSFTFSVGEVDFFIDPGTYVYTPLPQERNLFRSTRMHNTLSIPGEEQNQWHPGLKGLFGLKTTHPAKLLEARPKRWVGEQPSPHYTHRRTIDFDEKTIYGRDDYKRDVEKTLYFHIDPDIELKEGPPGSEFILSGRDKRVKITADGGRFSLAKSFYSPGYGSKRNSKALKLDFREDKFQWKISVL